MTYIKLNKPKKISGLIVAFLIIGIILGSNWINLIDADKMVETKKYEVVVFQLGTEHNVQIAVDTFCAWFPYPEKIKILQIDSWKELQTVILAYVDPYRLVFTHGSPEGICFQNKQNDIVSWVEFKDYIDTYASKSVFVFSCYSKSVEDGIYYKPCGDEILDAEAAGMLGAFYYGHHIINPDWMDAEIKKRRRNCLFPLSFV